MAATLHAPTAQAFPYDVNTVYEPACSIHLKNIWYYFDGSGWDVAPPSGSGGWDGSTYRGAATAGFELWDADQNRDGSEMVTLSPTSFTGATKVLVRFSSGGSYYDCSAKVVYISDGQKTGTMAAFRAAAAHEMGHALGPDHADDDASFVPGSPGVDPVEPLMSTCNNFDFHGQTVDDAASLTHTHAIGAARTITANYGFEDYLTWWKWSGAAPTIASGGTSGGYNQIMVVPNSSSDNIHQTVNYINGHHASSPYVRPSLQYATPGATSGQIRLQLFQRVVTYAYNPTKEANCQYSVNDADMNLRTYGLVSDESAMVLALDEHLPLSDTWRVGQTSSALAIGDPGRGSFDLRVRVFSTAAVSTGYIHTHYDDLRIQEG